MNKADLQEFRELSSKLSEEYPILSKIAALFDSETVRSYFALKKFRSSVNKTINDRDAFILSAKDKEYERVNNYLLDLDKYDKVERALMGEIFADPEKKADYESKRATEQIAL